MSLGWWLMVLWYDLRVRWWSLRLSLRPVRGYSLRARLYRARVAFRPRLTFPPYLCARCSCNPKGAGVMVEVAPRVFNFVCHGCMGAMQGAA